MKLLIENGAKVNKEDKNDYTSLIDAYRINNENIKKLLIENDAYINKK